MRVFNINGTSTNKCSCGSWLDHWKKYSGQPIPSYCCEKTCTGKPEVGAHVQAAVNDSKWYIVPLCKECNMSRISLDIGDTVKLVPANVSETCARTTRYSL